MRKRKFSYFLLLAALSVSVRVSAQKSVKDTSISAFLIGVTYAAQLPDADMLKRYGWNSSLGMNISYKTKKNLMWGLEGSFMFGNEIKEPSLFKNIATPNGDIIGNDGKLAEVKLFERGYTLFATAAKIIAFKPNPNSGFIFKAGAGFMEHKIRIEVLGNNVPQLSDAYKKGYDRLTNGIAFSEFIGYMFLGNNRMINFFAGIECIQAFTKNRRIFNFDTMQQDATARKDLLYGIRAGWIIPLYKRKPADYYYN